MRFLAERDYLVKTLALVGRAAQARGVGSSTRSGIKFVVDGNLATLTATDIDTTIITTMEVDGKENGSGVIPSRLMTDIARSMPEGSVSVVVEDDKAIIEAGRTHFEVQIYPLETFPPTPDITGDEVELPAKSLSEAISQVVRSASDDEVRPVLTGVLLSANETSLRLVATDSYRLAIRDLTDTKAISSGTQVLVPAKALHEVDRMAESQGEDSIFLYMDGLHARFRIGNTSLTTQLINDSFPSYEQLIPKEFIQTIKVEKSVILEAIKRMRLLVRDATTSVRLTTDDGGLELAVITSEVGKAVERMDGDIEGEATSTSFNPQYLADGIEAVIESEVMIRVPEKGKPALISGVSDDNYRYVLMPVRVS
ncbi:MAG: DNA polymerase III subunit beta [Acidimicrobiales bacterium]|nr:DNA polymerase III subunit beta [Acidimicrobiales bacterium]